MLAVNDCLVSCTKDEHSAILSFFKFKVCVVPLIQDQSEILQRNSNVENMSSVSHSTEMFNRRLHRCLATATKS